MNNKLQSGNLKYKASQFEVRQSRKLFFSDSQAIYFFTCFRLIFHSYIFHSYLCIYVFIYILSKFLNTGIVDVLPNIKPVSLKGFLSTCHKVSFKLQAIPSRFRMIKPKKLQTLSFTYPPKMGWTS